MNASGKPIGVAIVEDNRYYRETLVDLVSGQPGMHCTFAAATVEEALQMVQTQPATDVVLMDLELPGKSGLEGIAGMTAFTPETHIVVLTIHQDDERIFRAVCAGACGYLLKPATPEQILDAIETAVRGGAPMNAFIARRVLELFARTQRPAVAYGLTEREREILQLLVEANAQKQIARRLGLSHHTVDTHLRNIYSKLHVHSRTGAVAKALQERLL